LTDAEIDRLLAAAVTPDRMSRVERFCWIALDACARRAAIEHLRWDTGQVDFEARLLHFNPPGREQTSKRRASVPMSGRLLSVMQRAYEERTGPWVLDSCGSVYTSLRRVAERAGVEGVHPHVLRHTAAMELLGHGVDRAVIALWLGHESVETTQMYLHADMRLKEQALARTTPTDVKPGRYRPPDQLLAFLERL
jgi:integrase